MPCVRTCTLDTRTKLTILADAAKYDASCASSGSRRERVSGGVGNTTGVGICHSYTPDGRCVSLLKLLLTNYCIYDCTYCINRVSSDTPRARFTPEEVVSLTLEFYKRNYIEGLFLSSGVIQSPDYTMEQVIAVAKSLRTEHLFGGYIHLKIPPGASALLIAEAGKWADRLSANIEMPRQADLDRFAPAKTHIEIQQTMGEISQRIIEAKEEKTVFAAAGQSTQMIVGATEASDTDILQKSSALYQDFGMRRVYYSAFSPIPHSDSRLPPQAAPLVREHRLYQADWLLRYYGFDVSELTTAEQPDLPLDKDPKLAWALRNRHFFPVDVNTADREALLRIPGLGVRSVDRILAMRSQHRFRMEDLTRLTRAFKRMRYFVVTSDFNPDLLKLDAPHLPVPQQLSLFSAVTGEF